jgi:hypothetical protein
MHARSVPPPGTRDALADCRNRGGSFDFLMNGRISMLYTMLIYMDEERFAALPVDEQNRVHRECTAWHEELVNSGHSIGATGLQPTTTATTLRERHGKLVISDGPFAETKEVLGGFEALECKDLDEAIAIAKRFPALRIGSSVELRPGVPGNKCVAE